MLRSLIFLVGIPLLFCSCGDNRRATENELPVIKSQFNSTNRVESYEMIFNHNRIWTYGLLGDTLGNHFRDSLNRWSRKNSEEYDKIFDVIIDTTSRLPLPIYEWDMDLDSSSFKVKDWLRDNDMPAKKAAEFRSLPVYIINRGENNAVLEFQDGSLFMICEALDSTGRWEPIEAWQYTHFCGNSYYERVFPPDYLLVTRILEYSGEYKTQLRVKLRNFDQVVYSQPFTGQINYKQFSDTAIRTYSYDVSSRYHQDSLDFHAQQYFKALTLDQSLY